MSKSKPTESRAITMLKTEHRNIEKLFKAYFDAESEQDRRNVATRLCTEIKIHEEVKDQIFYPLLRARLGETPITTEGIENSLMRNLIAKLDAAPSVDERFDIRMTKLKEYCMHHVRREEHEVFPALDPLKPDLDTIAEDMEVLRASLESRTGNEEEARLHGYPSGLPVDKTGRLPHPPEGTVPNLNYAGFILKRPFF